MPRYVTPNGFSPVMEVVIEAFSNAAQVDILGHLARASSLEMDSIELMRETGLSRHTLRVRMNTLETTGVVERVELADPTEPARWRLNPRRVRELYAAFSEHLNIKRL